MGSLQVFSDKLPKGAKPVGKVGEDTIAYVDGVPIAERVKTLTFPGQCIIPIPYVDLKHKQRSASFVSGVSGCGKSTVAVHLIRELRKLRKDPERFVAVFSTTIIDDPAYARLKNIEFISLQDPRFLQLQVEELENRIIVFDDHENLKNPALEKYARDFLQDVLERTRKLDVDVIVINHMTQNYHKTRTIINECDTYYLNVAQNKTSSRRFLLAHSTMAKRAITALCKHEFENPFSFVALHRCYPCYLIREDTIELVV
jgi:hypothetical protein